MSLVSLGDMAQTFMLRGQINRLKGEVTRTTAELASGQKLDVAQSLNGDTAQLSSYLRAQALIQGYQTAASDQALQAEAMQSAVETVLDLGEGLVSPIMTAAQSLSTQVFDTVARDAQSRLTAAVAALNVSVAGRYPMAGVSSGSPPLPSGELLLADLQTVVDGASTPEEVVSRLSDWFNGSTGYSSAAYAGGDGAKPVQISRTEVVSLSVTANDPEIRRALHGLAVAAMLDAPNISLNAEQRQTLATMAYAELDAGNAAAVNLGARIGTMQQQIDVAQSRNGSEALVFESRIARDIEADPFTLATELEAVQTNLEMVYSITARLSRLHLSDYL